MIPQTRTDLFLAKITGEDVALPVPQTRFELYLANIAGESYELPAPNSRATLYLAKILGQDVALPVPQTRSELYLASIAGMSVQLPEAPTTREEWYLARWAEDAGYVTITGNPVTFNAVAAKLRQLKIAFSPVQEGSGDPSPENERPIHGWTGVNVWQRGKNLFDPDNLETVDNPLNPSATKYAHTFTKAGTYALRAFVAPSVNRYVYAVVKKADGTYGQAVYIVAGKNVYRNTVTITDGQTLIVYNAGSEGINTTKELLRDAQVIVAYSDTLPSEYVPYNPASQLIPVVFPDGEIYYDGWADPCTGVMAVTGVGVNMPANVINASWYTADMAAGLDSVGFYHGAQGWESHTGLPFPAGEYTGKFSYCKTGWVYRRAEIFTAQFLFTSGNFNRWEIRLPLSVLADTSSAEKAMQSAKDYLTEHTLQAFYKVEPFTVQLTPQQINSLAGANTMWSDANGDLTAEYRKDGNVSDAEALSMLLGGRYSPAQGPEDVPDSEALSIIAGGKK